MDDGGLLVQDVQVAHGWPLLDLFFVNFNSAWSTPILDAKKLPVLGFLRIFCYEIPSVPPQTSVFHGQGCGLPWAAPSLVSPQPSSNARLGARRLQDTNMYSY